MEERYSLFLEMYEMVKTYIRGYGDALSYLSNKNEGHDRDYEDFENIIVYNGFAEPANYAHGLRVTQKGLDVKPFELRRAYLKLKPESQITSEELYREVLQWIQNNGDSHIEPILVDIGINPKKAIGLEGMLDTKLGYIRCNDMDCFITDEGEAFLFGFDTPEQVPGSTIQKNVFIMGDGNVITQDSRLDSSDINVRTDATNNNSAQKPPSKSLLERSWKMFVAIVATIAALIAIYEFIIKKG